VVARQIKAANLRAEGKNYRSIARDCGYKDPKSAWFAVQSVLKETMREAGRELINLECGRYDHYLQRLHTRIEKGDPKAVDTALRISDRRCKLLGLAVMKLDVTANEDYLERETLLRKRLLDKLIRLAAAQQTNPQI
jgi:hypothetical protein